jgi:hypothetical protein
MYEILIYSTFYYYIFYSGSVRKSNGVALQSTISGLMGMSSPSKIQNSIKTLPHQHDSLEGPVPYLNGFAAFAVEGPETLQGTKRKPLYAKNQANNRNSKLVHADSVDETRSRQTQARQNPNRLTHQSSNGVHPSNSSQNSNGASHHPNHQQNLAEDKL